MAYSQGSRVFWGLAFMVGPAVRVPRPETEWLVEGALGLLGCLRERPKVVVGAGNRGREAAPTERADASGPMASLSVLELGTGSGAAAVALARELTGVTITATDVSPEALAVAARNGASHGAAVTWLESDWFEQVHGRFDLIVSNPPYVAEDDPHLADLRHEPLGALAAGPDGLAAIRRIVAGAGDHLTTAGALALEHGCDQGAAVRALLESAGYHDVTTHRDLAGLERVTWGRGAESSP
jgi:release factor glutamine methyltransferase